MAGVNILSQTTEKTFGKKHIKKINSLVSHLKATQDVKVQFVTLDAQSMHLLVFSDGSFACNDDLSSQSGFILLLADKTGSANILHCSSAKTKRIVRSVLGAETLGLSSAADMAVSVMLDIDDMMGKRLELHMLTDSETLFSVLVKSTTTIELRLMIDIASAKQSFDRDEITTISWIRRSENIADAMTKVTPNQTLLQFLRTNKLVYNIDQLVVRTNPNTQDNKQLPLAHEENSIDALVAYMAQAEGVDGIRK